nr:hypothetical protein [Tanacetum cinerariifolium]
MKKTEVYVTSCSCSSDLASKFLNFLDIPPADTEIVSPLDVHVHHEVPRIYTSILLVVPVSVILKASPVYTNIPQSSQTFNSPPLQSTPSPLLTTETRNIPSLILDFTSVFRFNDRVITLEKDVAELKNDPLHTQVIAITKQVRNQLSLILPEEVSNFASLVIEKMIQESLNQVNMEKASSKPQSTYDVATTLTEFELKKILIDKINSSESYLKALEHRECYDCLIKSYNLNKDLFSSYDVYSLKQPTISLKTKDSSSRSFKGTNYQPKSFGKSIHVEEPKFKSLLLDVPGLQNLLRPQEPTDLDWNKDETPYKGPTQNWLMTLTASTSTGGISTMTYTTSNTKTKATQYDLPCIEDMVPNIWSPVKLAYDKYALWGISHWKDQRKTFYAYARGIQSRGDVYSTKRIMPVTHVSNRLINLSGDDVADFAIALRMFTRSLVIQKDIPLDSLVVLRYEKRSKSENKGKVPTKMELVLEQTQQDAHLIMKEITAKIDGKVKVVTEASVRRHYKLEDLEGAPSISPPHLSSPPRSSIRRETNVPQPSSPTHTHVEDKAASIESLEEDLKQTKKVYGVAYTKLIIKVKKLEKTVKTSKDRRKTKIVEFDEEVDLEDPSKQGRSMREEINQDVKVTLVTPTQTYTRRRAVSTGSGGVSTANRMISTAEESVSTAGALMPVSTAGMVDKGKGIMEEYESDVNRTKRQQAKERLGLESSMRLQEQFDEEERQRMARVRKSKKQNIGESSKSRNKDVDELSQEELQQLMIIVPEQGMNVEALQTKYLIGWEIYTEDTRKYWKMIRVGNHTEVYQFFDDMFKAFDRDDLV